VSHFAKAVAHLIDVEGGYVDHPLDSGGPTKFGVTLATLASHRGHPVTAEDVRQLTPDEASEIYRKCYWDVNGLDGLTSLAVATIVLDQSANRGPRVAARMLQAALRSIGNESLAVDGQIGPATIAEANATSTGLLTFSLMVQAQKGYLDICRRSPSQGVFLAGWFDRTHQWLRFRDS
jgi:lysozyme family protein